MCLRVGGWFKARETSSDFDIIGAMVKGISYRNAKVFFLFLVFRNDVRSIVKYI
jgi:hypothetical protein